MKKSILCFFAGCLLISTSALAAENIFETSWWQKATIENVKEQFKNIPVSNIQNVDKKTPLMFAVSTVSDPNIIKIVLRSTDNINLQDKDGKTALMYACQYANPVIVNLLLRNNADVSLTDGQGKTALDYAQNNENVKNSSIIRKLHLYMSKINEREITPHKNLIHK